ncbi:MAG: tryptophan-rich sensory protein [Bradyrhizobiaceae bacterium]|nr:MAG: tryptophan-rich sensory protein [Bradyrhizobiaceae bacterium]
MSRYATLAVFLVAVLGGGIAIGIGNPPGAWYAALNKPPFNPPNWIFAPAWTTLYILIAVAGWRTWLRDRAGAAMKVWFVQLALNFAWSPLFFGAHKMVLGLIVVSALAVSIAAFIALTRRTDRIAAWLFAPYLAWVSFATLLNASLVALN